jgi:hypothetical protein
MKREFSVEANVGAPQVAYRETIRKACDKVEGKFVKQSGGRGQYGHVWLKVEPNETGKGYEFVDAIKGGSVPREYIPAVQKGILEALPAGVLAGFPVVDVKVTLFDGSYHEVDSNENAFKMAGLMAFKEGLRRANPALLEPIMAVEVETPEDFTGNVMGDLSSRRGVIQGMDDIHINRLDTESGPLRHHADPPNDCRGWLCVMRAMQRPRIPAAGSTRRALGTRWQPDSANTKGRIGGGAGARTRTAGRPGRLIAGRLGSLAGRLSSLADRLGSLSSRLGSLARRLGSLAGRRMPFATSTASSGPLCGRHVWTPRTSSLLAFACTAASTSAAG